MTSSPLPKSAKHQLSGDVRHPVKLEERAGEGDKTKTVAMDHGSRGGADLKPNR